MKSSSTIQFLFIFILFIYLFSRESVTVKLTNSSSLSPFLPVENVISLQLTFFTCLVFFFFCNFKKIALHTFKCIPGKCSKKLLVYCILSWMNSYCFKKTYYSWLRCALLPTTLNVPIPIVYCKEKLLKLFRKTSLIFYMW